MNTDNTLSCVQPALSLGYRVSPDDKDHRLSFDNSYCTIRYVNNVWVLTDLNNDTFEYHDLKSALLDGAT